MKHPTSSTRDRRLLQFQNAWVRLLPSVETLEPRYVFSAAFDVVQLTQMQADPDFAEIDGRIGGERIGIAILDSGVHMTHPDLRDNFVAWFDAVNDGGDFAKLTGPGSTNINDAVDFNGHGTHVAGTAASSNSELGVATEAGIIGVRVLGGSPNFNPVVAGLNWVENNRERYNIRVVNMSLQCGSIACGFNSPIQENAKSRAIDRLEQAGVTVVSASGNAYAEVNGLGASDPAVFSSLSVANTWEDAGIGDPAPDRGGGPPFNFTAVHLDPQPDQLAATSQRSTLPNQVAAPGSSILSTWNGELSPTGTPLLYNTISGTSMASPLVSGVVALMQDAAMTFGGRYLTVNEVVQIVRETGDPILDAQLPGTFRVPSNSVGFQEDIRESGLTYSRVNAYSALQRVRELVTRGTNDADPPVDPEQRRADTNNTRDAAVALAALDATNRVQHGGTIGADGLVNVGPGDVDLFRVTLESPGELNVTTRPQPGGAEFIPVIRLFDSEGAEIGSVDGTANGGYPSLTTNRLAVGTYFVGISGFGNSAYDVRDGSAAQDAGSTGDYNVSMTLGNPDPNGVVQGAVEMDLAGPNVLNPNPVLVGNGVPAATFVGGQIGSDGNPLDATEPAIDVGPTDVDIFQVIAPDTGVMIVDINARDVFGPAAVDTFVRVFDANLNQIAFNDDGLPGQFLDSYLEQPVTAGETYFVAVTTFDNREFNPRDPFDRVAPNGETGFYELYLSFTNGDVNGTAYGAIQWNLFVPPGQNQTGGTIGSDFDAPLLSQATNGGFKDVDFFVYTASQAALLEVSASRAGGAITPALDLWEFTPGGDNILRIANTAAETATLLYEIAQNESIYISVTGLGNQGFDWFATASGTGGDTGPYSLSVTPSALNLVANLADDSINNHTPTVLSEDTIVFGQIGRDANLVRSRADVDLYRFTPTASGTFVVNANAPGNLGADPFIRLFDDQGQELGSSDSGQLPVVLTANQTYFIGINASTANSNAYDPLTGQGAVEGELGPYLLSVSRQAADSAGDFDDDGQLGSGDLALLAAAIQTQSIETGFDLNGDGSVTLLDRDVWLVELRGTRPGDTDLDGSVVFSDFLVLTANFGATENVEFGDGDFDLDGDVDFNDFLELTASFGFGVDG